MDRADQIQLIKDFLKSHDLCVVSTVNGDQPTSAVLAFSETDDLKIIFGTSDKTRKYSYLMKNPKVSFVLGWDFNEFITIQFEGEAHVVQGDDVERIKNIHITKNPGSKVYADLPDERWFVIDPKWIRYSDLKSKPEVVFDLTF